MASIKDFHTRKAANQGIKVSLVLPTGEETEDYLIVAGRDSDKFREKETEILKRLAQWFNEGKELKSDKEDRLELLSSLVLEWSFEEKLSEDSVIDFLREAPQITDQIEDLSNKRELFVKKKSKS